MYIYISTQTHIDRYRGPIFYESKTGTFNTILVGRKEGR